MWPFKRRPDPEAERRTQRLAALEATEARLTQRAYEVADRDIPRLRPTLHVIRGFHGVAVRAYVGEILLFELTEDHKGRTVIMRPELLRDNT